MRKLASLPTIVAATLAVVLVAAPLALAQSGGDGPEPGGPERGKPERSQPPQPNRVSPGTPQAHKPGPPFSEPSPPSAPQTEAPAGTAEQKKAAAPPPDTPKQRRRALDDLYAYLAAAHSAQATTPLVAGIERLWLFSGSDTIDVLMERVMKAVAEQNLELAGKLADAIVDLEPGFAEGWNRRALVSYLRGDRDNALNALRRALALEPNHFKALDGIAQIMRDQGDKAAALKAYQRLLDVHPYWDGARDAIEELKREIQGQGI